MATRAEFDVEPGPRSQLGALLVWLCSFAMRVGFHRVRRYGGRHSMCLDANH